MEELKPHVVIIGGKSAGKTSAINAIWGQNSNVIHVSEFAEGRGEIDYDVEELPYIPFSISEELEQWFADPHISSALSTADVIVNILEYGDVQFGKKIGILNKLNTYHKLKNNVSFVIGLNKIEYFIEAKGPDEEFLVPLDFSAQLLNYVISCRKILSSSCQSNDNFSIIPFASFEIQWNIEKLKTAILEGVINRHNDFVYNPTSPTVVFIGKTGCGKSSTINTICNTSLPVDGSAACTKYPIVINKCVAFENNEINVNIVDLPGIAESLDADVIYQDYYNRYIKNATVIVCLSQANTRAYTQDEVFFRKLYEIGALTNSSNIILAINKIDLLFKTKENPNGIDLHTLTTDNQLLKEKVDDYFNNVFAKIFYFLPSINLNYS